MGLYLTPVPVADFMATLIEACDATVRLLDPAAGAGVLCCAAVERLVSRRSAPGSIELVAYESDPELCGPLATVLEYLAEWCRCRGVLLTARIESRDFVVAHAGALQSLGDLLPSNSPTANFDAVIANPPYFKIGRNDPRALAVSSVVHGQPNIYALFMAVGAALLRRSGEFVQIVPRSFASGALFSTIPLRLLRPHRANGHPRVRLSAKCVQSRRRVAGECHSRRTPARRLASRRPARRGSDLFEPGRCGHQ